MDWGPEAERCNGKDGAEEVLSSVALLQSEVPSVQKASLESGAPSLARGNHTSLAQGNYTEDSSHAYFHSILGPPETPQKINNQ
eukprot:5844851-Amphidinium_carterae.1